MEWNQPHYLKRPLKGQDGKLDHPKRGSEEGPVMKVTTIGIDLARRLWCSRGRRRGSSSISEAGSSQPAAGVPEPVAAVFSGPGSLQQRTLLGAQDRAARSSSKTYESAVRETLSEKRQKRRE